MPLTPKRPKLQADLVSILQDPTAPLTGRKLAKALSKFSLGILPPTIGIFTGIVPAAAAYDNAPPMNKTKGIEDAIMYLLSLMLQEWLHLHSKAHRRQKLEICKDSLIL